MNESKERTPNTIEIGQIWKLTGTASEFVVAIISCEDLVYNYSRKKHSGHKQQTLTKENKLVYPGEWVFIGYAIKCENCQNYECCQLCRR